MAILLFASCTKDPANGDNKISICHKTSSHDKNGSIIIEINKNTLAAHLAHGDVRLDDVDGDGYVPDNACGFGKMGDCADNNAAINPGAKEILGNSIDENCNGQLNELGGEPDSWYYFRATFEYRQGYSDTRYFYPADWNLGSIFSYKSLVTMGPVEGRFDDPMKFKVHQEADGWFYLETNDAGPKWLSLSYAGWLFRGNKDVKWKIVDGKLYNSYSRWEAYPAGARFDYTNPTIVGWYLGVNLADWEILTNCELVPAP